MGRRSRWACSPREEELGRAWTMVSSESVALSKELPGPWVPGFQNCKLLAIEINWTNLQFGRYRPRSRSYHNNFKVKLPALEQEHQPSCILLHDFRLMGSSHDYTSKSKVWRCCDTESLSVCTGGLKDVVKVQFRESMESYNDKDRMLFRAINRLLGYYRDPRP